MKSATIGGKAAWPAAVTWARRYYTATVLKTSKREACAGLDENSGAEPLEAPQAETVQAIMTVWVCFVEVRPPGSEPVRFRVNQRAGRPLSFTDPRETLTGIAGTTGIWGTRAPLRALKPRSLTPTAFRAELARLIGAEKAGEIIDELVKKFSTDL
jgi:hypothetical protein